MRKLLRLIQSEDGTTAVEYAVMLALILVAIVGAITQAGGANGNIWQNNVDQIDAAFGGSGS